MSRAVDFYDNTLKYRFIDLDLSVTLTLDEEDFLFIPGFKNTDSTARLNVPRDLFAALFYYNAIYSDLLLGDYTKIQYAMESWTDVSFSNATVDVSNQIIPSSLYQQLKYDYIRFILKEITGNNSTSGLFRNTDKLLQNVVSMDALFNSQIVSILAECGTVLAPKLNTSFYNNPGRILIQSILANDNVIETDNAERRTALITQMTTNATTFYNNSTAYYFVGTVTGENSSYCHFPLYLSPTGRTAVTFTDVSYTYYTDASFAHYTNLDTILIPYQVFGTVTVPDATQKYYYPVYLNNLNASKPLEFTQYPGYTFYTEDVVGKDVSGNYTNYSTLASNTTAYYVYGTKTGETELQMYFPIYLDSSGNIPVTFTDASYAGYPLYTRYNVYTPPTVTKKYTVKASYLDSSAQYYDVSLNPFSGSIPITFTDASLNGVTFYTANTNFKTVYTAFTDISYSVYGTAFGESSDLYYYPVYLQNDVGRTDISFTDVDLSGVKFYTTNTVGHDASSNYANYLTSYNAMVNSATQYYVYATKTGTTYQQYYLVYLNQVANSVAITFKEYPMTFYYTKNLNHYTDYDSVSTHNDVTAYYKYGSVTALNSGAAGYYYPLYTADTSPSTLTPITFVASVTLYTTTDGLVPTPVFKLAYEAFASSNYNPTTPYYIYGRKTGTDISYNYFPIYVNYPGHICSTAITFTNYSGVTFYTNYEEINTQFYPFEFEYGDSLSVRVTYKPKYNTYLGKEVHDYSYEVYLDMGLESDFQVPYKALGDENTSGVSVGEITYYDTKIYTSLGVAKVFHYILQNTVLPDLYTSPYNFYPTLQDISNVSFDMRSMATGKWFISIFCRPRTQSSDSYDAIGFDRFDSENSVSLLNYWTSFDLNDLTWTNGLHTGLTWANVLDIVIEPTTTPYGYIKTNGQQQIMVLAFSTDDADYTGSIRNMVVEFKDGRTITMT